MKLDDNILAIIKDSELEEKYEKVLKQEPDVNKDLNEIKKRYKDQNSSYSDKCNAIAQHLLMKILEEPELETIHSARHRVKTVESLLTKYIKKKAILPDEPSSDYDIEKYRPMTKDNYYKIITDLIGIRILIRYQQQWEVVHDWIISNFYKKDKNYIQNWIDDYPSGETEDFIVEKPKLYLRHERDLPIYQTRGKDVFDWKVSNEGYSSIHYLIWYDSKYIEIQVRTVYDEAWSECTHDLVYKCKNKSKRAELERLSESLATQTQAAEMITNIMFEKSQGASAKKEKRAVKGDDRDKTDKRYQGFEQRIRRMKETKNVEFDGSVDSLI